ncbi:MAG: hypothetical protein OK441_01205 [Thaumarchaeota archaeon]|nr:hypothetical protein [Nitrososphaerota archaeon]
MATAARPIYSETDLRRALFAISGIVVVMIIGSVGFHLIEGMNYINAVYFESMLATGQGPPLQLNTDAGKLFASVMAFVSVGSVITTLVFTLGPILTTIWREGLERVEREAKQIEEDVKEREKPKEDQ